MNPTSATRTRQLPGTANRPHYLPDETWAELVAAIMDSRFDLLDRENAVKIALGEIADVWPDSIRDDGVEFIDEEED